MAETSEERRSITCHFTFDERCLVAVEMLQSRGVTFDVQPVAATNGALKTLFIPRLPHCEGCCCGQEMVLS